MSEFANLVLAIKKSNDELLRSLVILKFISSGLINGYLFVGEKQEPDDFLKKLYRSACEFFPELHCFPQDVYCENTIRHAYYFSLNTTFSFTFPYPLTQNDQRRCWYPPHVTCCDDNESINTFTYYVSASVGMTWRGEADAVFDNILQFDSSSELPCDITTFLHQNEQLIPIKESFNLSVGYSVSFNCTYVERKLQELQPFSETELVKISDYFEKGEFREVSIRIRQNKKKPNELLSKYDDLKKCITAIKFYNENRWNSSCYQTVKNLDNEINENW